MKQVRTYCRYFWAVFLIAQCLTMSKLCLPYFSYQLNYDYISTVLCENKAKPEIACHGKCYLKKELKKAGEEEQHTGKKASAPVQNVELLMPEHIATLSYIPYTISEIVYNTFIRTTIRTGFAGMHTPPPQSVA